VWDSNAFFESDDKTVWICPIYDGQESHICSPQLSRMNRFRTLRTKDSSNFSADRRVAKSFFGTAPFLELLA